MLPFKVHYRRIHPETGEDIDFPVCGHAVGAWASRDTLLTSTWEEVTCTPCRAYVRELLIDCVLPEERESVFVAWLRCDAAQGNLIAEAALAADR
jgi:hypothetical protein